MQRKSGKDLATAVSSLLRVKRVKGPAQCKSGPSCHLPKCLSHKVEALYGPFFYWSFISKSLSLKFRNPLLCGDSFQKNCLQLIWDKQVPAGFRLFLGYSLTRDRCSGLFCRFEFLRILVWPTCRYRWLSQDQVDWRRTRRGKTKLT